MTSFVVLCVLLGIGHLLRSRIKLLHKLYLPSCVIGGLVGLLMIQFFSAGSSGGCAICVSADSWLSNVIEPWRKLPSMLINVVFACLFLGVKIPKLSDLWKRSGPQVVYGQIVAWGQYVVGLGLWVLVLGKIFTDLPGMFAGILPVGFEGGHGTAAGMGPVFAERGWAEGQDLAMTSATCGIMSAIVVGMILVNWAVRKGHAVKHKELTEQIEDDSISVIPVDQRPIAGRLTVNSDIIEAFSLHLVVVGLACGIGMLIKQGLVLIEAQSHYLTDNRLLSSFPLFPLCMIGGLIIQLFEDKFDKRKHIDLGLIRRIQNCSLDFLVVAAIAMISIDVVKTAWLPLLILVAAGIAWNVFCVTTLARRMLPDAWFERAIAEMGQSMGVTATGLLLLRVVDPDYDTPAADAFACKQIVHEPFMGGGLWTSTAIPLIAIYGPGRVFLIAIIVISIWLAIGWLMRIKKTV
jgi:ESS family glutamate:Na+ symporter